MTGKDIKQTARGTAKDVRKAGQEALAAVKSGVSEAASEAKKTAREEVETTAEAGKDMVADQGQRLARNLRGAAGSRGADSFQGRLLDTVASGVSDVSEGLRGRSLSSIVEQTEAFARRNPGAFVAGAAIAGFALARFARASELPRHEGDATVDGGHEATNIAARSHPEVPS